MMASYTSTEWKGIKIDRGQCITSLDKLAKRCNLSVKQIRGILKKLEGQGFLTRKGTNLYSIITICNYESYQGVKEGEGQSKGQSEGATKNNIFNIINQEKEVIINDKDVFSDETKKITPNSFSSFIDNIKKLCPTISEFMDLPNMKQYIALRDKYTDTQLLCVIWDIENNISWHTYKSLFSAIKKYLESNDIPNYEDDIP